jgi:Tol biopolymer transport system component
VVKRRQAWRKLSLLLAATLLFLSGCRSASWSPDGKTLALDVNGKLYLFEVAVGQFRRIDTGKRFAFNPEYSPDGARLTYYAITRQDQKRGSLGLWVRDLKTGAERRLSGSLPVDPQGLNRFQIATLKAFKRAAWSPDSRRVAYAVEGEKRTVIKVADCQTGETTTLNLKGKRLRYPAWSPDGRQLAYMAETNPDVGGHYISPLDLYMTDAGGGVGQRLWDSKKQAPIWPFAEPIWSPDGTQILLLTSTPEAQRERFWEATHSLHVRAVPADGGAGRIVMVLTSAMAAVAPDLAAVVYVGGRGRNQLVYKTPPFTNPNLWDDLTGQFIDTEGMKRHNWQWVLPYPVRSPDGRTIALLPLQDKKATHLELRLYDAITGKRTVYVLPK